MSSAETTSDGPMTTPTPSIIRLVFAACTVGLFGELPSAEEPPAGGLHTADRGTAFTHRGSRGATIRFATAVVDRTKLDASGLTADRPRLAFTSLSGHTLDITYRPHGEAVDRQHLVDGEPVDYTSFPLLGNPWVRQALDGDDLVISHGGRTLRYDFQAWTRSEHAP